MKRIFLAIVVSSVLGACANVGGKATNAQTGEFEEGKTNYAQVIAKLGPPQFLGSAPNGGRLAVYNIGRAHMSPKTFVPVAGGFMSCLDVEQGTQTFVFDSSDILTDMTTRTTPAQPRKRSGRC